VDLKRFFQTQGMKVMQDPRFMKIMQDERVMKTVMKGFQMKQHAQEQFDARVETVAKQLNLATKAELRDLKRALRKMEQELDKERAKSKAADGSKA